MLVLQVVILLVVMLVVMVVVMVVMMLMRMVVWMVVWLGINIRRRVWMRVAMTVFIRSRLGFKRCLLYRYGKAKPTHHVVQHMIMLVAHPVGGDLQRNVAIAQVVAGAGQSQRVVAVYGRYRLGGGLHLYHQAPGASQQVTAAQDFSARQKQARFTPVIQCDFQTTFDALVDRQAERCAVRMRAV